MVKPVLDKQVKKAISDSRVLVENAIKADLNEADTAMRIERMFETLMGYDIFKHLTHEFAVRNPGDNLYCDYAIQIDEEKKTPVILVEVKKVNIELAPKHLRQAASYAIDVGCEWAILTNGKTWQLHHISFGQPPETIMLDSWDLVDDATEVIASKFETIGYKSVKRGGLKQLWEKNNVLTPHNVLKMILSEESISMVKRGIKKSTDVNVTPEEIVGSVRHLLNESALGEMDKLKICLPNKKPLKKMVTGAASNIESTLPPVVEPPTGPGATPV